MKNPTVVLVSMLVILSATACASTTNADDLIGIWTQGGHLTQFNEDDTYTFANTVGALTSGPIEFGEFRLEGTRLTFIPDEESRVCAGKTANWEVEMAEDGSRFKRTLVEDDCVTGPVIPSVFFERYSR